MRVLVHPIASTLLLVLTISVAVLTLVVRYGVLTPIGRAFVETRLEGLSAGPLGRLHVEGLSGDLWSDFSVRRLTLADAKGVWLDASSIRVVWSPSALLQRKVQLDAVIARQVRLLRRPVLIQGGAGGPAAMSIVIANLRTQVLSEPTFSTVRGLFQVAADVDFERDGGFRGAVAARSLLHPGDGLDARLNLGRRKTLALDAKAREGPGGALAGALGLPTDRPFRLDAHAGGLVDGGRLYVRVLSGDRTVAQADGSWTKDHGSANGRLSLAASTLSAKVMRQLGQEVRFAANGSKAGPHLYRMSVRADADNAWIAAAGLADADQRAGAGGVHVTAAIKDLSRLVAQPAMGAGSIDAVLAGGAQDWRLTGNAAVARLAIAGYSLARVQGPFDLRLVKRELHLQMAAAGAGGAGQGLLAALAGARPQARLEASRLDDGRMLIRTLSASGVGLKLDASGARGLFGDLGFKGDAQLSNLAAARPGARGLIDARWSAAQGRADRPWALSLDARGPSFTSGVEQLDRLLGSKPVLTAQGGYDKAGLALTKATLTGAAGVVSSAGLIGNDGAVKLALNWSADGPFTAGPLEFAGKAKGTGDIGGTLSLPRADLIADFDRIDLPELALKAAHVVASFAWTTTDVNGQLSVAAGGDYGPTRAHSSLRFVGDGLELSGIDAAAGGATAQGSLSLRRLSPSTADLTMTVGPGAFATEGHAQARVKIVDQPGGATADMKLTAADFRLRGSSVLLHTLTLTATGPLSRTPYTLSTDAMANDIPVHLTGAGVAAEADKGYSLSFSGSGRVRRADFHTLTPAQLNFGGPDSSGRLSVAVGGGRVDAEGAQNGEAVNAKAAVAGVDLGLIDQDLAGRFNADLALSGRGATLGGTLEAHLDGARSRDASPKLALNGVVHARLAGGRLSVEADAAGAQSSDKANVTLSLPAEATAAPFRIAVDRTRPIGGRIDLSGELQPVWELFFGGDRTLGGALVAQADVGGTLNDPRLTGHASLTGGHFEDASTGLKLRSVAAEVALNDNQIVVQRFTAADAKSGTLTGEGQVSLTRGGSSSLTLNAHAFQLLDNDQAKASATGAVTVTRAADGKAKLSGQLTIDRADISAETRTPPGVVTMEVTEVNRPGVQNETAAAPADRTPEVALDIKLTAPGRVFVRGLGLNAELSLDAQVSGTTAAPVLQGAAHVVRGDYDFAGKRFEIDDRGVVYLATSADKIRLDLTATRDDPTLTAIIRIQGTAAKPEITLTSTPTLPNDEVLSQVLFGRAAAQLSPVEAAQLAAAVTTLATGGGFDVMGGLRNFARLDRLALGGDATEGVTVSGGKYIGARVYLELTGGGRQGPSAQVEYRATRNLSVISQVGGLDGAKLAVRWRHDYGRAPAPKANP